jgi:hypothetical protein
MQVGFSNITLTDPNGNIDKTEVEFRGISPSRTVTLKGNLDLAVVDHRWWAVRGVAELDYKRREDAKEQVKFDDNTLTAGARFDVKLPPHKHDLRLYVGYFWEGELRGPRDYFKAKITKPAENGYSSVLESKTATLFTRDPLQFQYLATGIDVMNPFKLFSESSVPVNLTKFGIQYGGGRQHNVPTGAKIDGVMQPSERYVAGLQTVLDKYYEEHETSFDPGVVFIGDDESRRQQRLQYEFSYDVEMKLGSKTWKFGNELRRRLYPHTRDTKDNSVRDSWRVKFSLTAPIIPRLEIVPTYEWQSAHIYLKDSPAFRQSTFEINFKVPIVFKAGWGRFFG